MTLLLLSGIMLFLFMIITTNIFHFTYRLNADISSEAVLGKEIWDTKQLVPNAWYSSTETRIIGPLNFTALFYGLTHNMLLAMGLACCTVTLFITGSMAYLGKSLGLTCQDTLLFIFLGLSVPVLFNFLEVLYLFACYYSMHVITFFLTLGCYASILRKKETNRCLFVLDTLLAFILGLQGLRGALVLYIPLFCMELVKILHTIYCRKKSDKTDKFAGLWVMILLFLNFAGTLFPASGNQELSRNIRRGFEKLITVVVPNVYAAIGLKAANPLEKTALILMLLLILYLLTDILWKIIKKQPLEVTQWVFLVICISPIITAFIMAFTTYETTERYYFMFTYAIAFAPVLLFNRIRRMQNRIYGKILSFLIFLTVSVIAVSNLIAIYIPIMKAKEPPQTAEYEVARYLEENNLPTGYSTFDHANNLTVLSNGKVRVAAVASLDKMDVCKWLSSADWYVPNVPYEERTAYIIPEARMDEFSEFLALHEKDMQFETQIGNYFIYSSSYNFSNLGT